MVQNSWMAGASITTTFECGSAWGLSADRRAKPLVCLEPEGSLGDAYLHRSAEMSSEPGSSKKPGNSVLPLGTAIEEEAEKLVQKKHQQSALRVKEDPRAVKFSFE